MDTVLGLLAECQTKEEITQQLTQLKDKPDTADWLQQFIQVVIAILNGSHDKSLANDTSLEYSTAAEILFLIERLP